MDSAREHMAPGPRRGYRLLAALIGAVALISVLVLISRAIGPLPPDPHAPHVAFAAYTERLMASAEVVRPAGDGPFPVVLQFHGCGGSPPSRAQRDYAQVARDAGWATVMVNSYAVRGVSPRDAYLEVCRGLKLWGRERAGDVYAAVAWTKTQPWANGSRIVALGWSHGGWTVLDALALHPGPEAENATKLSGLPKEPLQGLVGAFVLYPYVGWASIARREGLRWDVAPLALVGSRDIVVGGESVRKTLQRMKTPGAPVRIEWFPGATHAFDEPGSHSLRTQYDPEAAARAKRLLVEYLESRRGIDLEGQTGAKEAPVWNEPVRRLPL
jgi:dienelactone hydrolase